jgi:NAD(P)-dependent dehydrogenase (short-subunit alcohol dehydrogenase family)
MAEFPGKDQKPLEGKTILITGAARRLGLCMAKSAAVAGAHIVLHYRTSQKDAENALEEIRLLGSMAYLLQADLANPAEAAAMIPRALEIAGPLFALVNSASIFMSQSFQETTPSSWQENLAVHMTAPFLLSKSFADALPENHTGRIVNMLDWRSLRPGADHFAYNVSKAGLVALTQACAAALAPRISVNGLALGAILPPEGKAASDDLIKSVPARRWGDTAEVENALLFLLTGPAYITGEIIHIDGGRHLI